MHSLYFNGIYTHYLLQLSFVLMVTTPLTALLKLFFLKCYGKPSLVIAMCLFAS